MIFNFIRRFVEEDFVGRMNLFSRYFYKLKGFLFYRLVFSEFGRGSVLFKPIFLANVMHVKVGKRVQIRQGARIELICAQGNTPNLFIGDDVNIEQNVHIICRGRVTINGKVSVAPNCVIVDTSHPYDGIREGEKIGDRIDVGETFLEIGEGTFISAGVTILPKVKIGRYCFIGANSVVNRDIPDYCVAVGSPARVVKSVIQL